MVYGDWKNTEINSKRIPTSPKFIYLCPVGSNHLARLQRWLGAKEGNAVNIVLSNAYGVIERIAMYIYSQSCHKIGI